MMRRWLMDDNSLAVAPGALLTWLVLQLLVLALPVAQVPLSENFTRPVERRAVDEIAILQIAASALLSPMLFRNAGTFLAIAACSWPFLMLAGFLSATPTGAIAQTGLYISAWFVLLALWRWLLRRSGKAMLLASSVAALYSIGGACLWYVDAEFVSSQAELTTRGIGPVLGSLALLHEGNGTAAWEITGVVLGLTILLAGVVVFRGQKSPAAVATSAPASGPA